MKNLLFISALTFHFFLEADYSTHKDSQMLIDELVNEYGFEEAYVIEVLQNAKRRDEMLKKVANPAEKTKTWDDYKAIFIKKKRIRDGKKFKK